MKLSYRVNRFRRLGRFALAVPRTLDLIPVKILMPAITVKCLEFLVKKHLDSKCKFFPHKGCFLDCFLLNMKTKLTSEKCKKANREHARGHHNHG